MVGGRGRRGRPLPRRCRVRASPETVIMTALDEPHAAEFEDPPTPRDGPLTGTRVLDLSHIASGPFATMLLADLGADVIKVERAGTGDGARQMDRSLQDGDSGYYLGLNKNKRSIALDLRTTQGRNTVRALAPNADVFVENFRPGAAARMRLGYDDIRAIRPDIVYCSITGFGASGPLRDAVAYDIVGQAFSGIMSITGDPDRPPVKCGAPIADLTSGMFATIGILAALHHRDQTGSGQHVGTSLLGASAALLASYLTSHAMGTPFHRLGSAHNTLAPYQAFTGSDGTNFILAAGNDTFFAKTTEILGLTTLSQDPRYATNPARTQHRQALAQILQTEFAKQTAGHWLAALAEVGVPASPINTIDDLVNDEQMRANDYVTDIAHPRIGTLPVINAPLTFSATPVTVRRPPPRLDQHRTEILAIAAGERSWLTEDN
ncbi:formyl-CoA transferase [Rhodococcus sp. ACPA1]|nr:formyl-CoA transferase [Rhodococcus sp. ACPA1]